MDILTQLSSLSESRVISELIKNECSVFVQFSGKEPFDLVAYKNNKLWRIEVKYTTDKSEYESYRVTLKSVRSNKTKNVIKKFNPKNSDIVAIYIVDMDTVCFISTKDITNTSQLNIAKKRGPYSSFVISEQLDLNKIIGGVAERYCA